MKRFLFTLLSTLFLSAGTAFASDLITPYFQVSKVKAPIETVFHQVTGALENSGFQVIGDYRPEGKEDLHVVVYTNDQIKEIVSSSERGLLAAALKVGLKRDGDSVKVSMLNPEYLFRGYLMKDYAASEKALSDISSQTKKAMQQVGTNFTPFGGGLSASDLEHYQYMFGMEYFDDPVYLKKFKSFDEGVATIEKNLAKHTGGTLKVYSLVMKEKEVAVFGVGLKNAEQGEPFFLPVIGEDHLAALPYEMILVGKKATMLHGRFRLALHWPDLTMGTFMQISGTPGDIEATMKSLCK